MCGPDPLSRKVRHSADPVADALGIQGFNDGLADAWDPLGAHARKKWDPVPRFVEGKRNVNAELQRRAEAAKPYSSYSELQIK